MSCNDATPELLLVVDATVAPVRFLHEDASVPATRRFHLRDARDFTLEIGLRAVIAYDARIARQLIIQVMPIPPTTITITTEESTP